MSYHTSQPQGNVLSFNENVYRHSTRALFLILCALFLSLVSCNTTEETEHQTASPSQTYNLDDGSNDEDLGQLSHPAPPQKQGSSSKPSKNPTLSSQSDISLGVSEGMAIGIMAPSMGISGSHGSAYDRRKHRSREMARHPRYSTDNFSPIRENEFKSVKAEPLSTFSIDVDRASYGIVRKWINQGMNPPKDAVRIEEMVNYFTYTYPQPSENDPFSITTEVAECPWNKTHKVMMIGLQGKMIPTEHLPPSNLVFLIDVSGSMDAPNRLPLVKSSLSLLVEQLRENDRVAIVVYAGSAGLVLPSTSGSNKNDILQAIARLHAGGSTAGGEGIRLAYRIAKDNFLPNGNNRVIIATDGDFNVGVSSDGELVRMIEEKRKDHIFLTVLGYGMGNYKDSKLELLAQHGNGNYGYIDNLNEAKKMLISEFGGTLYTIAKDVKIQVEFNPEYVASYRLIGYENRLLASEDFNNDAKDAGDMGAGHTVTALYEIIPVGVESVNSPPPVDPLKYQSKKKEAPGKSITDEIATVKCRYKLPKAEKSIKREYAVNDQNRAFHEASQNFRFATAVAQFGFLLTDSKFSGKVSPNMILKQAQAAKGADKEGYRNDFIRLVETYLTKSITAYENED